MPRHVIDGETCPECDRVHEVIESIPGRPASRQFLDALEETDRFTFARAAAWLPAGKGGEQVAKDIVVATEDAVKYLILSDEVGWFVMDEREVQDDETVEDVATDLLDEASSSLPRDGHH